MNPVQAPGPLLTTVLAMPRGFDELTGAIAHLRAQTMRPRIQVVVVALTDRVAEIDRSAFEGFHRLDVVTVPALPTVATGTAAGVRLAAGQFVTLVEDHVFVEPDWAARVCEPFERGCAAVAPLMLNGNPATAVSWMNFLVCFNDAIAFGSAGPVESGPGHNTVYRRSVLTRYEAEGLERLLQTERNFHYRLRADGDVIWAEPRARLAHVNISIPSEALRQGFLGGVMFAQYRSAQMSFPEKLARTLLGPAVPPLRLLRMAATRWRTGRSYGAPVAGWLLVPSGLVAHAMGEMVGYWGVLRNIEASYEFFELHRMACVRPEERSLMTSDFVQTPRASSPAPLDAGQGAEV